VATAGALAGCSLFRDEEPSTEGRDPATASPDDGSVGAGAGGEAGDAASPRTTPYADQYRTVVDVVEAGADPTGREAVDDVLQEALGDDTLLYFPQGRYLVGETVRFEGLSNVGFVGERATLVPPDTGLGYWLVGLDVDGFRFERFTLDHTAAGVGPQFQLHLTGGRGDIRDVTVRGFHDSEYIGFVTYVESRDATLVYDRVRLPDGSSDVPAVYVGKPSVGRLVFRNCYIEHWSQGIYASPHSGPVSVVGGEFANNNRAGIRLGGGRHGALVRDAYVRVDDPVPEKWVDRQNVRGIWLREGEGSRVENCRIELTNLKGVASDAALMIGNMMGAVTIRNTTVRMTDGYNGVRTLPPASNGRGLQAMNRLPDSWNVRCQNLRVDGDVDNEGNAIRIVDRSGSTFENVHVEQTGARRVGLYLSSGATDCRFEGGRLVTSEYPLVAKRRRTAAATCSLRLSADASLRATGRVGELRRLYALDGGGYCVNARPSPTRGDGASATPLPPDSVVLGLETRDGALWGTVLGFDEYDDFYERAGHDGGS
jgi:hypothetical protein